MPSYRILRPRIVYEVLNNEVIAIDFDTGTYFVLPHAAKQVWLLIEKQISVEQIAQLMADHYQRGYSQVLLDIEPFIEQLLCNGLIELSDSQGSAEGVQIDSQGWQYDAPKLMTYTDVQDLLLLDPIHEIAEVGWPEKP